MSAVPTEVDCNKLLVRPKLWGKGYPWPNGSWTQSCHLPVNVIVCKRAPAWYLRTEQCKAQCHSNVLKPQRVTPPENPYTPVSCSPSGKEEPDNISVIPGLTTFQRLNQLGASNTFMNSSQYGFKAELLNSTKYSWNIYSKYSLYF